LAMGTILHEYNQPRPNMYIPPIANTTHPIFCDIDVLLFMILSFGFMIFCSTVFIDLLYPIVIVCFRGSCLLLFGRT
jgi:hypothetical protein